jgi:hypothetical protein
VFLKLTPFEGLCSQYFQTDKALWFHFTFVFYSCEAIIEELFLVCPSSLCHLQGKIENDYSFVYIYVYDFSILYNFNIVTHNSPGYEKESRKTVKTAKNRHKFNPPHTTSAVSCQMYSTLQLLS